MWGRNKQVQPAVVVAEPEVSLAATEAHHSLALGEDEFQMYEKTCKTLGYEDNPALRYQRLLRFLKAEGIKTIPYQSVEQFLNKKYPQKYDTDDHRPSYDS